MMKETEHLSFTLPLEEIPQALKEAGERSAEQDGDSVFG